MCNVDENGRLDSCTHLLFNIAGVVPTVELLNNQQIQMGFCIFSVRARRMKAKIFEFKSSVIEHRNLSANKTLLSPH